MAFSLLAGADRGLGNVAIAGLLLPALVAASVGGFALQRAVADDGPTGVELPANRYAVPVYDCPRDPNVADVHNGDRVFAIGVHDELDGWLLIRNPIEPSVHWWIENRYVATDSAIDDLPDLGCDDPVPEPTDEVAAPAETTTTEPEDEDDDEDEDVDESTTTTDPDEPTTTTEGNGPTTTRQQSSTTTTRSRSTTTTTKPRSTTTTATTTPTTQPKPSISGPSASPGNVWERYNSGGNYSCSQASVSTISASINNASSVVLRWSGAAAGSKPMTHQGGGTWSATLGPFDQNTVPYEETQPIGVTVEATGPGGASKSSTSITLHDCTFG